MEQKINNEVGNPEEQFKDDLRAMCRTAFGLDWMDRHPGQEAIYKLRAYGFLPEIFIAMYEVIGDEERLHQLGILPIDKLELEQQEYGRQIADHLIFCQDKEMDYALFKEQPYEKNFFNGLYCCAFRDSHLDQKSWRKWCYWGAQSQFQTLASALLRLIGEILSREMPNCVGVQVSVKKEGKLSRYETLAERLGCVALKSVFPIGWEYLCNPERRLLVKYSDEGRYKVLAYSQTPAELEKLAQFWSIEWKCRKGKKILDPAAFIQSTAPVTLVEKLEEMSQVLLGKRPLALPLDEIEKAEARLGIRFPDALREFYLRFGKGGRLMSDSMHTVLMPKDLDPKNSNFGEDIAEALKKGSLLLAIENQGVWTMYLDIQTGEPWLDWGEGRQDCWGLNLEETLLNLLAMNALEFLPQAAECEMENTPENRELLGKFFHFLVEGNMAVFVNPERGVVCFREDDADNIYIAAHKESEMNKLEADIDLQLSWF